MTPRVVGLVPAAALVWPGRWAGVGLGGQGTPARRPWRRTEGGRLQDLESLAGVADLLAMALRSGATPVAAVSVVAAEAPRPWQPVLEEVHEELSSGGVAGQVWRRHVQEHPELGAVAGARALSEGLGVAPGAVDGDERPGPAGRGAGPATAGGLHRGREGDDADAHAAAPGGAARRLRLRPHPVGGVRAQRGDDGLRRARSGAHRDRVGHLSLGAGRGGRAHGAPVSLLLVTLVVAAVALWPGHDSRVRWLRREVEAQGDPPVSALTVDEVADASVLLAPALQSGRGMVRALEEVAGVSAAGAGEDLRRVAAALRWGRSMSRAWSYARRVWGPTATAFVVADAVGAPSASVLLDAAASLRDAEARRLEEAGVGPR
uniref:Type II secretion system F family protein n=1 Tax=Janibacter limosus TaxID=53458 RepID=A0AC61U2J7_9MICO|nr:type II secretion system F family protein [Janibacter limosus]